MAFLVKPLKVHRLKAMGSGDTNTLSRLKPTFAAAQHLLRSNVPLQYLDRRLSAAVLRRFRSLRDLLKASPKGEGFHPSPMGTLNENHQS